MFSAPHKQYHPRSKHQYPTHPRQRYSNSSSIEQIWLLLVGLLLLAIFPIIFSGLLLFHLCRLAQLRGARGQSVWGLVLLFALLGAGGATWLLTGPCQSLPQSLLTGIQQPPSRWQSYLPELLRFWGICLLYTPAVTGIYALFRKQDETDLLLRERERDKSRSLKASKPPKEQYPPIKLGKAIPVVAPINSLQHWQRHGYVYFPASALSLHVIAIGASGAGKSETQLAIASHVARWGWQVFYLDCKGTDWPTAHRFQAAMEQAGIQHVALFPDQPYNGWQGDEIGLYNKLLEMVDFSEPYYEDICKRLVALALRAPGGLPRNSKAFLDRLNIERLKMLYAGQEEESQLELIRVEDANGVHNRYASIFDVLHHHIDGGWSWDTVNAAYILIPGLSLKSTAEGFGRFLIEDFAHYCAVRKPPEKRVLFIIDEYSALSSKADAANLIERVRSLGASVILSSQTYERLGPPDKRKAILGAAGTIILHRSSDPEELIQRAGTQKVIAKHYQLATEEVTGRETLHVEEQLIINPNAVRMLPPGTCYLIHAGQAVCCQVQALSLSPQSIRQQEEQSKPQAQEQSEEQHQPEKLPPIPAPHAHEPDLAVPHSCAAHEQKTDQPDPNQQKIVDF